MSCLLSSGRKAGLLRTKVACRVRIRTHVNFIPLFLVSWQSDHVATNVACAVLITWSVAEFTGVYCTKNAGFCADYNVTAVTRYKNFLSLFVSSSRRWKAAGETRSMRRRSTSSWWLGRIMGFVYVRKWDVEERGAVFREKSTDKGCFLFFLLFHGLTRNARWASHRISRIHQKRYLLACKPLKPPSSPWSPNETTTLAEGDDVDYTQFQVLFFV